ncbi:MAG TPA: cytochrome c [Acetobacteraceae bacterium]|jgi:mono/diheme cytochrome c family protein|nr:cytochrome c [Acetobacteraceae bacterium]
MRRWIGLAAGVVLLGCIAAAAFFFWPAAQEPVTASATQPTGAALVARGDYLTKAADCAACHTVPGGQPFAGGLAFRLPFGTIYSPNITPDPDTGIGSWSDAAFVRALHRGIGRNGKNLYPAFPYTAYALLSTDDALAIRAYLAMLPPVHAVTPANDLSFPFDQRYLMRAWNLLFLPTHPMQPDPSKDEAWNRGAYLVEALGHCGECHTPRNFMMGLDQGRKFAGAEQVGWLAYNLTSDRSHGLGGWSDAQLEQYLAAGHADGRGPASGPMAEAVGYSLRYLNAEDVHAMAAYLRGVPAQSDGPLAVQAGSPEAATNALGSRLFMQACAGCHLPNGDGRQSPWAALRGADTAGDPAGTNLVQVLTHGTQIQTSQGLMFMDKFTGAYTDQELAALANYTTSQFGFRPGKITPEQIRKQRGP